MALQVLAAPFCVLYRLKFTLSQARQIRVHLSGDERYECWLDGARIGRGPQRGKVEQWHFHSFDWNLNAGEHTIVARVWSLGERAPYAQLSHHHGWLLCVEDEDAHAIFNTGHADWQARIVTGLEWRDPSAAWGTGDNVIVRGEDFLWDWENGGDEENWQPATSLPVARDWRGSNDNAPCQLLAPATLPPLYDALWKRGQIRHVSALESRRDIETRDIETRDIETHAIPIRQSDDLADERATWQQLWDDERDLTIAPHRARRVLLDLGDYVCAYPELLVSGGRDAMVRINWQEALFQSDAHHKGNRDQIEGKFFTTIWHNCDGIGDSFIADGGAHRRFDTLWWQCGRFVEIVVVTQAEPLTLHALRLHETRYPLENQAQFECDDARFDDLRGIGWRTLQMCAHETYFDCPFYEQLMYIGDTRLQCLVTYTHSRDDCLPRQALRMFDLSRAVSRNSGLTQSRYPSRVYQSIPPFSLWHIGMLHDFALWRGDVNLVRELMPGARGIVEHFGALRAENGLPRAPDGWNFIDWVPAWQHGMPQDDSEGCSGPLCWQNLLALRQMAQLELWLGESEMAARWTRWAVELERAIDAQFWNETRGLWADNRAQTRFSEHSQALAVLALDGLPPSRQRAARGLISGATECADLARATIYFSHYVFEALRILGQADEIFARLPLWFDLSQCGLKTTPEMPEPTRSDRHAWGAHPLYHMLATLGGVRPQAPGCLQVLAAPLFGPLQHLSGTVPTVRGDIRFDWRRDGQRLSGGIEIPAGVQATLRWNHRDSALQSGWNAIE